MEANGHSAHEPAGSAPPSRRMQLLDAAIRVIAAHGLRGLTHRAVQQEAGLPHGSVTYYFKTRDQLVFGVIDRITELERAQAGQVADELLRAMAVQPFRPDYPRIAELTHAWWSSSRDRQVARYELQLAGTREPRIDAAMRKAAAEFRKLTELVALATGSPNAADDGEVLLTYIDGLMFHFLVETPENPEFLETGIRLAIESLRSVPRTG
ncbi:TetR family transcriptional regulator [Yinghuangia sp. ASG 101]|uniref:TetR/AcrR family transcriptional regulator n=1 Tax=Yinghuangia sp. ASG 101 TaxID=2896848 RepID=UPI001E4E00FC|nr:TetR family transcriptional regulator [Yinghuangia sp. ASG 101]UGQ09643.1 TetR family transcriptional regulator [Yinghuangia sp. ASG 101]